VLGQYQEALQEFRTAREQAKAANNPVWKRLDQDDIPRCEKELALDARMPALADGTAEPATEAERRAAALVAYRRGACVAAARFFLKEAQTAVDRTWFDEHTFIAACAAARAGYGEGPGGEKLSADERAGWRRQALAWLRHDLPIWEKRCRSDKGGERAWGRWTMRAWTETAPLAGVRDKERLERLPAEERAEWEKLWSEIRNIVPKQVEP
jgi:hypothetical protein